MGAASNLSKSMNKPAAVEEHQRWRRRMGDDNRRVGVIKPGCSGRSAALLVF